MTAKQRGLVRLLDSGMPFDQIALWVLVGAVSASDLRAIADELDRRNGK